MEALLETWRINGRLNLYLLDAIPIEQLETPLTKGKSVRSNFSHIHSVRLMWLKSGAPDLLEGLEKTGATDSSEVLKSHLIASAEAIETMIARAETPEGRVKGFKPHATAFVGYFVAHEAYHRTCIELALRQAGTPLSDKVAYGIWEWGVR